MTVANQTSLPGFILLGISSMPELRGPLFLLFLLIYLTTLVGNIMMIVLVTFDLHLQTPVYFFLRVLSFTEVCYTSVTIAKLLHSLLAQNKWISFVGCAAQLYFFSMFGTVECFLLAVMAYDRYAAICHPLSYTAIVSRALCLRLSVASWATSIILSLGQITFIFHLPFCGFNILDHFFCDIPPLIKLACGDTFQNEITVFLGSVVVILTPFLLILVSYGHILIAVLRMHSACGRRKAFSTCASHLTSVSLLYGTGTVTYIRSKSGGAPGSGKLLALLYSVIVPMLNPMLYSLRNKEVKAALRRLLGRRTCS